MVKTIRNLHEGLALSKIKNIQTGFSVLNVVQVYQRK
jgi:hypothetical protein